MSASCSATQAPVTLAVRVPPSAWSTSQSTVTVYSPRARRLVTVRRLRPIRRSISIERPFRAPVSRLERRLVDAGSIAYSAVTHPARLARRHAGSPSSMVAAHSTLVSPNSTRHEPSACFITSRVSLTGRIASAARPFARLISICSMASVLLALRPGMRRGGLRIAFQCSGSARRAGAAARARRPPPRGPLDPAGPCGR